MMFSSKRAFALAVSLVVPAAVLPVLQGSVAVAAPIPAASLGTSAATAAGSCYEIKQVRSSAPSGSYWLQTPAMSAPAEFYCDQSTDGGGWVLVGKGRDGWVSDYAGKGVASQLKSPDTVPMSSATVQLSSKTVDELLNGTRVDALSEGIRVRRAQNRTGTSWQDSKFKFSNKSRWSWTFGAEHPVSSWSFGLLPGWGGTSASFGSGSLYNRMDNTTGDTKKWKIGFGFGSSVAGYTDSASYLWSAENGRGGALPYAQVFIRPRVTSTDAGFKPIGDAGTPAVPNRASLNSNALVTPWGVNGLKGSTSVEGSVEVQAFTQSGNRMFVGGNFRYVQKDAAGTGRVEQSYLAAFDVNTGEWDPTFRPLLNEQVKALATLPDGSVVAGGNFSQVNGASAPAIVALDPATGATKTDWKLNLENRTTGGVLRVRALDVHDGKLYVGGAFTHFSGGTAPSRVVYSRNIAAVDAATATPDATWSPDLNGSVIDIDASDDGSRVYTTGYFSSSKGVTANRVASISSGNGGALSGPAWNPTWSNREHNYQQAVQQVGNRVFVGGAEHALFQFDTSSFNRLAGNIMKKGGDLQAAETDGELLYASCHCAQWTYSGAYTWENIGTRWSQADTIKWLGVWNAATGEYVPDFTPNISMRLGSGPWDLQKDSNGTLWVGGDIETVRTGQGQKFSGGFARFPRADSTPPNVPANLRVSTQSNTEVTLAWNTISDPAGGATYEILRGDRTVATVSGATTVTLPHTGTERYFVRAVDRAGNVGASTSVLSVGPPAQNQPPVAAIGTSVTDRTVEFDGSGSSDDRAITSYAWSFGDGATATGAKATHTYAGAGTYTATLTVTDSDGATHSASKQVTVSATTSSALVPAGSAWQWYYRVAAPGAGWNGTDYDASGWDTGDGTFGWGASNVKTSIDTFADPTQRPITAYFRKTFEVTDPSKVVSLTLDTIGDDGVVLHVNGVEVGRENMREGAVTHTTYAPTARRSSVAATTPLVVTVPASLLKAGTNVIAAETHVNYRRTPDLTFDLKATLVSE